MSQFAHAPIPFGRSPSEQAQLHHLFARAIAGGPVHPGHESELHEAVCEFVRAGKAVQALPEHIIVMLRSELASLRAAAPHTQAADALLSRMVAWAIKAYYRPEECSTPATT